MARKLVGARKSNRAARMKLTPRELARRMGVSPDKILTWIRSGELRAINAATRAGGRPRYLIDKRDITAFEASRSAAKAPAVRQAKSKKADGVIDFF